MEGGGLHYGILRKWNTTAQWNGPREFPIYLYSRDTSSKACFNPPHDDITNAEGLHFRQKVSITDGAKGLGKIKVDDIICVYFVFIMRVSASSKISRL